MVRSGESYEHWVDGEVFRDIRTRLDEIAAKKEEIKAKKAALRKQISALPDGASRSFPAFLVTSLDDSHYQLSV